MDADIAGQAVDFGGAQQLRRGRVLAAQPGEQTDSALEAAADVAERQHLAAAVRMDFNVLRKQRCKRCGIAIPPRHETGLRDPASPVVPDAEVRPGDLAMLPPARGP